MKKNLLLFTILFTCGSSIFAQVPSYVPTNGLVGWWPFNGNANDESGNGNNGTVNGATLTTDRFGNANKAYSFNGNGSISSTNSLTAIENIEQLTISVWFEKNIWSLGGEQGRLISYEEFGTWSPGYYPAHGTAIQLQNANSFSQGKTLQLDLRNGVNSSAAGFRVDTLTIWHNVIMVFDNSGIDQNSQLKMYIDGVLFSIEHLTTTYPNTTHSVNSQLVFGHFNNIDPIFGFGGLLDDIGIWNRALTECEILDLYNTQLGTSSTVNETACENYTWNGTTYSQSGQYNYQTLNANGCDSTATLNLTINQPSSSTQTETALDSYTWPVNGQTYTQSGTYTAVIPNAAGCDSTITLDLTLSFTGIDEQVNSKIIISPNPAIDYFMVIAPEELIGESYSIIDLNGKTLKKGTLMQKEQKIEIGNLSEGMYMFKINNETEQTFRIIKN